MLRVLSFSWASRDNSPRTGASRKSGLDYPAMMVSDNGTELTSNAILEHHASKLVRYSWEAATKARQRNHTRRLDNRMR